MNGTPRIPAARKILPRHLSDEDGSVQSVFHSDFGKYLLPCYSMVIKFDMR